ncbi:hypothetical protein DZF91_07590, partial [Actinomadura logoneensis]
GGRPSLLGARPSRSGARLSLPDARLSLPGARPPLLGAHRPLVAVLLLAGLFRLVAALGYRPAIWFTDSITYLDDAVTGRPGLERPSGYSLYLWLLKPFHSLTLVTATQHLMGLAVGVLVYAVACRCRVPRWGALLAAAPVLFDAYQIELERLVMSDTLFLLLGVSALAVVLWWSPPPWWAIAVGGVLAGASTVTRPTGTAVAAGVVAAVLLRPSTGRAWHAEVALPVPVVTAGHVRFADHGGSARTVRFTGPAVFAGRGLFGRRRRRGRRGRRGGFARRAGMAGVALAGCAAPVLAYGLWFSSAHGAFGLSRSTGAPVLAYGLWFSSAHGAFGLSRSTGVFLYGRVMAFAECPRMHPPPELRRLCTRVPPERRMISQNYIWRGTSPLNQVRGGRYSARKDRMARRFALRAIAAQPADYLRTVGADTLRAFAWDRTVFPDRLTYDRYLFGTRPAELGDHPRGRYVTGLYRRAARYELGPVRTRVVRPWSDLAHAYQRVVFLRGTLVGLVLLAVPAVALVRRGAAARLAAGPWLAAVGLVVLPAATAEFDYRYVLTAVPFGCLALALSCASRNNPGQFFSPAVAAVAVRGEAEGGRGGAVAGRGVRRGP